ncbi:hypothetical protein DFH06DRAFT_1152085 [Mycena polygramma]|nr:hypothetical protein DFH06DRAFT_1152085 [Mycena polygramma]
MKVNTAKSSSSRYSPLVRDTNRPLRRPRKASQDTINKKTTARLFASSVPEYEAPLSGYGALCSQVGETQFFAQFGTDVALPVANAWSPVSSPAASPTSSPSIKTPPLSPSKQPASSPLKQYGSRIRGYIPGQPQHIDFRPAPWHLEDPFTGPQDMDLDPWPLDAEGNTVRPDYLDDDFLAGTAQPSWEEMHPSVKIEVDDAMPEATSPAEEFTELNEFETWVVRRIREAHSKGESVVDGLHQLKARAAALEKENAELTARLADLTSGSN